MNVAMARYTDRMGQHFETEALPRIAGRIFGLLLVSEGPVTLNALAEALEVSKGSVSTDARLLVRLGVAQRITLPGDRRDYYRVAPDLFARSIAERLAHWQRFSGLVGDARRNLPIKSAAVNARLAEFENGYATMISAIRHALERHERRPRRRVASTGRNS